MFNIHQSNFISGPVVSTWLPWGFHLVVFSIDRSDSLDIDHRWHLRAMQPEEPRLACHWQNVIPNLLEEVNHCFKNRFAERTVDQVARSQDCVRMRPGKRVKVLISLSSKEI